MDEVPALIGWLGEDALARVVKLGHPRVVETATAELGAAALTRADLTPSVSRSLLDWVGGPGRGARLPGVLGPLTGAEGR